MHYYYNIYNIIYETLFIIHILFYIFNEFSYGTHSKVFIYECLIKYVLFKNRELNCLNLNS
jgi:hypothetical protein